MPPPPPGGEQLTTKCRQGRAGRSVRQAGRQAGKKGAHMHAGSRFVLIRLHLGSLALMAPTVLTDCSH